MKNFKYIFLLLLLLFIVIGNFNVIVGSADESLIATQRVDAYSPNTWYNPSGGMTISNEDGQQIYMKIPVGYSTIVLNSSGGYNHNYCAYSSEGNIPPCVLELRATTEFNSSNITWNNKPSAGTLLSTKNVYQTDGYLITINYIYSGEYVVLIMTSPYYYMSFGSVVAPTYLRPYVTNFTVTTTSYDTSGYIKNSTGIGITSAQITLMNSTYSATKLTSSNGYYNFSTLSAGSYTYAISKTNYSTLSGTLVVSGNATNVNYTLTQLYVASPPSISFDYPTYITGETITITAYATSPGTIVLLDPNGNIKYSASIAAQQTKTIQYTIQSSDISGVWRANLKNVANSIVVYDTASINVPSVVTPTTTTSASGWMLPDVFMWLRIYMPTIVFFIGCLYVISLTGSTYQMFRKKKVSRTR